MHFLIKLLDQNSFGLEIKKNELAYFISIREVSQRRKFNDQFILFFLTSRKKKKKKKKSL